MTPISRKKRPKSSSFFLLIFLKKYLTSKCAGYTVSRALREIAFLVREQKTQSCLFAQNHEFWSHCALSVGVKGRDRSRKENTHASKRKTSRRKKFVSCDARLVKNITFVAVDNFEVNLTISGDF